MWSVGELADYLSLPKSTVHRLLATLLAMKFVCRSPVDSTYGLGTRIAGLAIRAKGHEFLAQTAQPVLQSLVDETGESAFLAVKEGLHALCIARVNTPQKLALLIDVGVVSSMHLGASNTALLAFLPPAELSQVLAQTVIQPSERLDAEARMRQIAADGFAYSSSQLTPGAAALGIPILNPEGYAVAGLSLGAPEYRFGRERAIGLLPALRRAAREIRERLGYPPATLRSSRQTIPAEGGPVHR